MKSVISRGFGHRIRQLRDRFGLSAGKFAAQIGFDRSYIFRLENGNAANPSLKFIESVVQKFGVDREWLIEGVGDGSSLKVDVVPHRSGIDGHIKMRLECLQSIIDACTNAELKEAFDRFVLLAEKDKSVGKIFDQVAEVISATMLRRMMKNSDLTEDSLKGKSDDVKSNIQKLIEKVKQKASQPGAKAELARMLDVAPARITEWLSGKKEPGGDYALRLQKWVESPAS